MKASERRIVLAVFGSLRQKSFDELNTFLGSGTIDDMTKLYWKLKFEPYCREHKIKYEKMTEDDVIAAQEEIQERESLMRFAEPEEPYECEEDYYFENK